MLIVVALWCFAGYTLENMICVNFLRQTLSCYTGWHFRTTGKSMLGPFWDWGGSLFGTGDGSGALLAILWRKWGGVIKNVAFLITLVDLGF